MTVYLPHEQRRQVIVNAGVELANRHGLVACSFAHVAELCNVVTSVATVRDHFRTKSDLWRAIAADPRAHQHVKDAAKDVGIRATVTG